jgi:mono/diheme cytochrome c family protein
MIVTETPPMNRILPLIVGLAWLGAVVGAHQRPGSADREQPRQDYNSGDYLYRVFCASCHGVGGAGDGVVADTMRVRPSDLTLVARRNGGMFPRDRVYAAIDGRQKVAGHGLADMPVWGDVFKRTEGQNEALVKKRIDALVAYLESIQAKTP